MQVVSLAQVGELWWIITVETSEQGWISSNSKPAKEIRRREFRELSNTAKKLAF